MTDSVDRDSEPQWVENELKMRDFSHIQVRVYGSHLILYSLEQGDSVNRARLTKHAPNSYSLSMANHRGKWESTPFQGSLEELLALLCEQFGFVLAPW